MYDEIVNSHKAELRALETQIRHRSEWASILKADRLQRALSRARRRDERIGSQVLTPNN